MAPKPKWEPKKMPTVKKAPLKPNTTKIAKPKKYPKGSVGREWSDQVAASQKHTREAAAAWVAYAASCQLASVAEPSTTSTPGAAPADDSLAHSESDLESDPFSDIYR